MRSVKLVFIAASFASVVSLAVGSESSVPVARNADAIEIVTTIQAIPPAPVVARPAGHGSRVRAHTTRARKRRGSLGLAWPVPHIVTQKYGRTHGKFHHGVDIRCARGEPALAAMPGRVTFVGRMPLYGGTIIIKRGHVRTLYGHLSRRNVHRGQRVGRDSVIGFCGNTGRSTGPHLHFEVYFGHHTVDPRRVLPRRPIGFSG